jgi:hypothetical protein
MRRLILANHQSPSDIVMVTGAVRDLHRSYPGQFTTDVRTPCESLWDNSPYVTSLAALGVSIELSQDGDECDWPQHLCVDVRGRLPACMDLITAGDVTRRVEYYLPGGDKSGAYALPS